MLFNGQLMKGITCEHSYGVFINDDIGKSVQQFNLEGSTIKIDLEIYFKPLDLTDPNVIASLAPEGTRYIAQNNDSTWKCSKEILVRHVQSKTWMRNAAKDISNWSVKTGIKPADWTKEIYEITPEGVKRVEQ